MAKRRARQRRKRTKRTKRRKRTRRIRHRGRGFGDFFHTILHGKTKPKPVPVPKPSGTGFFDDKNLYLNLESNLYVDPITHTFVQPPIQTVKDLWKPASYQRWLSTPCAPRMQALRDYIWHFMPQYNNNVNSLMTLADRVGCSML